MSSSAHHGHAHLLDLLALISQSVQTIVAEYDAAGRCVPSLDCTDPSQTLDGRAVRDAVCILESACAQLCASVAPAGHTMVNRAFGMVDPACLRVALTARTAERLQSGPKHVSELASLAGMDAHKLGRVLRNLAIKHCFREVSQDVYANNKLSVCLLPEDTISGIIGSLADELCAGFVGLSDVLVDPEWAFSAEKEKCSFVRAHGATLFEFLEKDPIRGPRFPIAMQGWTKVNGGSGIIADLYPWQTAPKDAILCDLGSSTGHMALALMKAHPHIKAVIQDLPIVIAQAQIYWEQEAPGLLPVDSNSPRVQLVITDFFVEPPVAGCDFYYLKHIMHDWPDDDCVIILRNVRKAMTKKDTKVLIHEIVLTHADEVKQAPFPLQANYGIGAQRKYNQDLLMLSTLNSRERFLDEFIAIAEQADLKFVKVWDGGDTAIVEFEAA